MMLILVSLSFFFFRLGSEVYKARSKKDGSLVALKKILMHNEKDGVSLSLVFFIVFALLRSYLGFGWRGFSSELILGSFPSRH